MSDYDKRVSEIHMKKLVYQGLMQISVVLFATVVLCIFIIV